jgi:hypothetical protein
VDKFMNTPQGNGLSSVQGALLVDIQKDAEYSEEHLHHKVRWFTKKTSQSATEWCSPVEGNLANYYRAISGNSVYGADANDEAKVFGTADVPISGMVTGDFDEMLVIANSSLTMYLCRIIWGTGTLAEAVAMGQYSEFPYIRGDSDKVRKVMTIPCEKVPVTISGLPVKIWVQVANATDNATIDFVIGVHGYNF